jgi:hemoglobin
MPRSLLIQQQSPPKATNTVCPITGKPVDPAITAEYEGRKVVLCQRSLQNQMVEGTRGQSVSEARWQSRHRCSNVDAFYVKVLADDRVKHFFDDVSMDKQRRKQKEFLSAAFGGPLPWTGKDMRKAHDGMGLTEVHFNAIAENLVNTLKDLKISQDLIDQVVAVALTTKDDVLGRPKKVN